MDLWKEIERDIAIDFSYNYNNVNDSDNVIRNVFLDSVASSTPARHPGVGNDTLSNDLSLMIDLQDITGDGAEVSQVTMPELVIDDNFDQMIDQILDEIDLNNTDSVVTYPAQPKSQTDSLPSPLAESTPKKNAVSVLKRPQSSSQSAIHGKDINSNDRIKCNGYASSSPSYQLPHKFDHDYGTNPIGVGFYRSAQKKYKPYQRKPKLVSVLKSASSPNVSIGNFFSNFSPDVTNIRKLDRYLLTRLVIIPDIHGVYLLFQTSSL